MQQREGSTHTHQRIHIHIHIQHEVPPQVPAPPALATVGSLLSPPAIKVAACVTHAQSTHANKDTHTRTRR